MKGSAPKPYTTGAPEPAGPVHFPGHKVEGTRVVVTVRFAVLEQRFGGSP